MIEFESRHAQVLSNIGAAHRTSAKNLLHYLAMRKRDLRSLQTDLAMLGLSSIGRAEAHALSAVNAVRNVVRQLAKQEIHELHDEAPEKCWPVLRALVMLNEEHKQAAVHHFGYHSQSKKWTHFMIERGLKEKEVPLNRAAIQIAHLQRLADPKVIERLGQFALKDDNGHVRTDAAQALVNIGAPALPSCAFRTIRIVSPVGCIASAAPTSRMIGPTTSPVQAPSLRNGAPRCKRIAAA